MRDFRIPSFRRVDLGYARDSAPAPPKFHHVFISYTTREEEYKQVQEFSEVVVEELKRRGLKRDIAEFIWLDKLELSIDHRYRGKKEIDLYRGEEELEKALRGGLDASRKFLAFVSPEYAKSKWCQFEYEYAIRHLPILDIIWKGPSPVRKWWNARVGVLDARPCFSTERLTEPRGLIWQTGSEVLAGQGNSRVQGPPLRVHVV